MPTIKITASQVVYYEKTLELDQDDYNTLIGIYENERSPDVMQWLVDGDLGFIDDDIVESEPIEDLEII